MANTAEILRIMRHAADLLDAQEPRKNADTIVAISSVGATWVAAHRLANAETVAIRLASHVLRLVAAVMEDGPDGEPS